MLKKIKFLFLTWWVKLFKLILTIFGRSGTSLPGLIVERYFPESLSNFQNKYQKIIFISGTNGKTTTKTVMEGLYRQNNLKVSANSEGANIYRGIATTLFNDLNWLGQSKKQIAILEVEEATLPKLSRFLKPDVLVLTNIFRDQLDVYGEIEQTLKYFTEAINLSSPRIFVNVDDKKLLTSIPENYKDIQGFSISNSDLKYEECSTSFEWDIPTYQSQWVGNTKTGQEFGLNDQIYQTNIGGIYNLYNILVAGLVVAEDFSFRVFEQLDGVKTAFGRGEIVRIDGREITLFLVKNPAGTDEVLKNILKKDPEKSKSIFILTNDNIADGKDVSWYWDVDFESFVEKSKQTIFWTGGLRGLDMMLRLEYAGYKKASLEKYLSDFFKVKSKIKETKLDSSIYVLCTYTALLDFYKKIDK